MKVPVSTIVMATATAAALIVLTVIGCDSHADDKPAPATTATPPQASAPAKSTLDALIGDKPATIGPAFAGVEIGKPSKIRGDAIAPDVGKLVIGRHNGSDVVIGVWMKPSDCESFTKLLHARWGDGQSTATTTVWPSADHHERAVLENCHLDIRRVTPVAELFDSVVPVWAIDKPADKLRAARQLSETDTLDPWTMPGIGDGRVELTIEPRENTSGILAAIAVKGKTDNATAREVVDLLTAKYGAPEQDATTATWSTKTLRVSFERPSEEFELLIARVVR